MKIIFALLLFLFLISCENQSSTSRSKKKSNTSKSEKVDSEVQINKTSKTISKDNYQIITVKDELLGWGYLILQNGKIVIEQKHIPAIQGNLGFISEEESKLVANLVVQKILKRDFPPSISLEELDSLRIHF